MSVVLSISTGFAAGFVKTYFEATIDKACMNFGWCSTHVELALAEAMSSKNDLSFQVWTP